MKKFLSDVLIECGLQVGGTTALGTATATTVATSDNSTNIATTAFVKAQGYITSYTNNYITGLSFNTTNGVLTVTRQGLTNLTVDLDGRYLQSESDTLDTVTARGSVTTNSIGVSTVNIIGSTAGAELLTVDGTYGRLFTVTDDLSDSLFSVNTVAGLPALEVFADNTIKLGSFANPIEIDSSSNIVIPGTITASGYNDSNWNTAYNDRIASVAVSGTTNKTLTLTQGDGGTVTTTWTDNFDNYGSWNLKTNSVQRTTVQSGGDLDLIAGTDISISYGAGGKVTIASTATGSIDYVSDVVLNGSTLEFTGVGTAFTGSIDLSSLSSVETDTLDSVTDRGNTTTNAITVGGLTVDTDTLYVDATNNRVGIGTTSPNVRLHVNEAGTVNEQTIVLGLSSTSLRPIIQFSESAGVATGNGMSIEYDGRGSGDTNKMYINGVDNSPKLTVMSGGNVGIGTTSPANKLDVVGNARVVSTSPIIKIEDSDANSYATTNSRLEFNNNYATVGYINQIGENLRIASTGSVSSVSLYTNGSDRVVVNSSGNVGIGTTSPNHKVDIYSNENVPLRIHRPSNANLDSSGAWGIGFSTRADAITSTTDTRAGIFSYYNGNLFLAAANTSIVADPDAYARLTILNTGYVGIGTASPASNLHIATTGSSTLTIQNTTNSGNASLKFRDEGNVDQYSIYYALSGNRAYNLVNGNGLTIYSSQTSSEIARFGLDTGYNNSYFNGNVGVGATSPLRKLHVVGDLAINAGTGQYYGVYINGTGEGANPSITIGDWHNASANLIWDSTNRLIRIDSQYSTNGAPIVFSGNDSAIEYARFTGTGNFGLGNNNPVYKLHAKTDSSTWGYRFENNTGDQDVHVFLAHGGGFGLAVDSTDNRSSTYLLSLKGGTGGANLGSIEHFRVTSAGLIGAGTNAPEEKLHVVGNVQIEGGSTSVVLETNNKGADPAGALFGEYDIATTYGAIVDYVIYDAGRDNMRSGTFSAVWNGAETRYNDVSTVDIGDTSVVTLTSQINGANVELIVTGDAVYTIKFNTKLIK